MANLRMKAPDGFGGFSLEGKPLKPSKSGHYFVPLAYVSHALSHGLIADPEGLPRDDETDDAE